MARVEITAGGRAIVVQGDEPTTDLAALAAGLWRDTASAPIPPEPEGHSGIGFHTEQAPQPYYASSHQADLRSRP